jgi:hypothetical protein
VLGGEEWLVGKLVGALEEQLDQVARAGEVGKLYQRLCSSYPAPGLVGRV